MNQFFEMVGRAFDEAMKDHEDLVIIIDGRERSGKSALARSLAYYLVENHGANFTLEDNVYFTGMDVARMFYNLSRNQEVPPGTVHIIDEAQNIIHHRRSMSSMNIYFDEAIKSIGAMRQVFIFCSPAFWELDVVLRRADILVHVYKRGYAGAWVPPRLYRLVGGTLELKKKIKIVDFNQIISHTGLFPTMTFHFAPPRDEKEYNLLKENHLRNFLSHLGEKILEKYGVKITTEVFNKKLPPLDEESLEEILKEIENGRRGE